MKGSVVIKAFSEGICSLVMSRNSLTIPEATEATRAELISNSNMICSTMMLWKFHPCKYSSVVSQDMSLLDMQLPAAFGISLQSSWSPILQSCLIILTLEQMF